MSACPICHRFWSQEHVLCGCPSTTDARLGGSLDLAITVSRLTPGPMWDLGRHFQSLLLVPNQPNLMARRRAGQWDPGAIASLNPVIARCNHQQIMAVLGHVGRITDATTGACWRNFLAIARELNPPRSIPPKKNYWQPARRAPLTGILASVRTTDKPGPSIV